MAESTNPDAESGLMPPDVAAAYVTWLGEGERSPTKTARLLGIPKPRVANWVHRHRWKELAAAEDSESRDAAIATAYSRLAALAGKALATIEASIDARLDAQGKPPPGSPTTTAVRSAFNTLAVFGIVPQRAATLTVQHAAPLPVSDAELDALLAAGDMPALLALAAGEPLPPRVRAAVAAATPPPQTPSPPQDFTSGQPGGRGGRDPSSPITEPSATPPDEGDVSLVDDAFADVYAGFAAVAAREVLDETIPDAEFRDLAAD